MILVGTLRSNKRDVPSEMIRNKKSRIGTCMYCYDDDSMLASWVPYKATNPKLILLLSTMHSVLLYRIENQRLYTFATKQK